VDRAGTADGTWFPLRRDDDGDIIAKGLPVGRFECLLDVPPFAPKHLGPVTIGEEVTDLGERRLARGSTLLVRVRGRNGKAKSEPSGEAHPISMPELTRDLLAPAVEGGRWRVPGLSAGKWTLRVAWESGRHEESDVVREVEVDGSTDASIELVID
jgi:hypothetical protein